jgi:hypothetical protein
MLPLLPVAQFRRQSWETPNCEVSGLEKRSEATASTGRARPQGSAATEET